MKNTRLKSKNMAKKISVLIPDLPRLDRVRPYLEQMDANKWYSNWGPLLNEFESRLSMVSGIPRENLVILSNATVGLTLALKALFHGEQSKRLPQIAIPSWTFSATAGAVAHAGYGLVLEDIDPVSNELSIDLVKNRFEQIKESIDAVIPVAVFGRPLDPEPWEKLKALTGLKIVYDLAASMDQLLSGKFRDSLTSSPAVFSLHATKVFGAGEGGVVVSADTALIENVKRFANFGFWGSRESKLAGGNFKFSEIHAAYALAELDGWKNKQSEWVRVRDQYLSYAPTLRSLGIVLEPGESQDWISSYMHVRSVDGAQSTILEKQLAGAGVETRRWWGGGIHSQEAYRVVGLPIDAFKNTEYISQRLLGIPCHTNLSFEDIDRICALLARRAL